jgi:hypothetical protein
MSDPQQLRSALEALRHEPDRLIEIIVQQAAVIEQLQVQNRALEARIADLEDRNRRLLQRVDELTTITARSAAPFRIKDKRRVTTPKPTGRRPGHAGQRRAVPDQIDEDIDVPLPACPNCGHALRSPHPVVQHLEELPAVRPRVIRLTTYEGRCPRCRRRVWSTHPLQVSRARGAAGVQLGPQAVAVAAELNKRYGLTLRTTTAILQSLFGLRVTPGGLVQALARVATKLRPAYDALITHVRGSPVAHSDETSWWVGKPGWWLWVLATPQATIYRVADGRGRNVVSELLGEAFQGVLVSDCLAVYDGVPAVQQKCYAHHLKAIAEALEFKPSPYCEQLRRLLHTAMALKTAEVPLPERTRLRNVLAAHVEHLLATARREPHEERVRQRLWKQRDHLWTFLDHPDVDATNNLAERQLRPAVIARKLSCGNKTPAGARTWEVLTSLAATCTQRAESFRLLVATHVVLQPAR